MAHSRRVTVRIGRSGEALGPIAEPMSLVDEVGL
jgi:hypothetical protein